MLAQRLKDEAIDPAARIGAEQARQSRACIDRLLAVPPARGCAEAIARGSSPHATDFERAVAVALEDAGGREFCDVARRYDIALALSDETELARFGQRARDRGTMAPVEALCVERVEAAYNRLLLGCEALEEASQRILACLPTYLPPSLHWVVGRAGIGVASEESLAAPTGYMLHEAHMPTRTHPGLLNEFEWLAIDAVANKAQRVFQSSYCPNGYQMVLGAYSSRGSEWDVRTRLANDIEHVRLPFRLRYAFECDTRLRAAAVEFVAPGPDLFPAHMYDAQSGAWLSVDPALRERARVVYCMRLACLLACVCFGTSARMKRSLVTCYRGRLGSDEFLSCTFERKDLVYVALDSIRAGSFGDPALRFNPEGLRPLLGAGDLRLPQSYAPVSPEASWHVGKEVACASGCAEKRAEARSHAAAEASPSEIIHKFSMRRIDVAEDGRELPDALKKLFHARTVRDIDVFGCGLAGKGSDEIEIAKSEAPEAPLAAISRLEDLASRLAWPDSLEDADARMLYCDNPASRVLVGLFDEQMGVADEAEEYLAFGMIGSGLLDRGEDVRYVRSPKALYHAYMGLSDLYQRIGDDRRAYAMADRCIDLGPTTAAGYARKADILLWERRYAEAANVLAFSLQFAVLERDWGQLYYDLAIALYHLGEADASLAVLAYLVHNAPQMARQASALLAQFASIDENRYVPVSTLDAARIMKRYGVPLVPTDTAKALVARAAIGLVCAGMPRAAAPYAEMVAAFSHGDTVLQTVFASLSQGLYGGQENPRS